VGDATRSLRDAESSLGTRQVVNGPREHPGANAVEDERGNLMMLDRMNEHRRKALSKTLLSMSASSDATGPGG
jgi:DNA-directed RNA polymerase I subunit RPA1